MRSPLFLVLFVLVSVIEAECCLAERLSGEVRSVSEDVFEIHVEGARLPIKGDIVDVYVEIPGVGRATVASGVVLRVTGITITAATRISTTEVKIGQKVEVLSNDPVPKPKVAVPIVIGLTSEQVSRTLKEAGLSARFLSGVHAPVGVPKNTAYDQKPAIGAEVPLGSEVAITLYSAADTSPPNAPSTRTKAQYPPLVELPVMENPVDGSPDDYTMIANAGVQLLLKYHIAHNTLTPKLSVRYIENVLRDLDPNALLIFQPTARGTLSPDLLLAQYRIWEQYKTLPSHKSSKMQISVNFDLLSLTLVFGLQQQVFENSVLFHREVQRLLSTDLDFGAEEEFIHDRDTASRPRDQQDFLNQTRLFVIHRLLTEMSLGRSEFEARVRLQERFRRQYLLLSNWSEEKVIGLALTAFSRAFDSHCRYYSSQEIQNMADQMNNQFGGIGIMSQTAPDGLLVTMVNPGGPAEKSGRIHAGSVITGVAQGLNGEFVSVDSLEVEQINNLIRGEKGTRVRLQVRSPGSTQADTVVLTRDQIQLNQLEAASFSSDQLPVKLRADRIGYIRIPAFYGNYDPKGGPVDHQQPETAEDLKAICRSMSQRNVDLICLDLRGNQGGPLGATLRATGLFLDGQDIVHVKYNTGKIEHGSFDVPDANVDQPLIILTNRFTSGGGEIFAGALQDYRRALIIGDSKTQGSGTVRRSFSIFDEMNSKTGGKDSFSQGMMHISTGRMYRPFGEGIQLVGIQPDLIIPSQTEVQRHGTEYLHNPLPYDRLPGFSPKDTYNYGWTPDMLRELSQRSQQRMSSSEYFQALAEWSATYLESTTRVSSPLTLDNFLERRKAQSPFVFLDHPIEGIHGVRRDGFLQEVLHIAQDYLELRE